MKTTIADGPLKALMFAAALLAGAAVQAAELQVSEPWVALAPPGAHATAGFMELHNPGDEPVDLVAADADGFDAVELHRSVNENGMHRMIEQERITVPAGGSVRLAPGGYHVMLIGIQRELAEGENVTLELTLADGSRQTVDAPVTPRGQAMGSHDSGHGHEH
ncbi:MULTISPECIES: copper chaperone PCu(A)C [unclassified Guyparkeria]|uniref:copper chaperone PCu(A)C n=1 Tax=unclassified Guyparkeria TaxID=2626246 RepID=UPI000824F427|nr:MULTISPECIES: copper chaperone PCu(A)C [unclassified Guyparkeria]